MVGGVEGYLAELVPELRALGHELAFWCEVDTPADRTRLALPEGVPGWCVAEIGAADALRALREWRPDVVYVQGMIDPELEAEVQAVAPSVFFLHAYQGACISGTRTHRFPAVEPCGKTFGAACLLHYYPRRCGGLNPLTMWVDFLRQKRAMELLQGYAALATHSEHMEATYRRQGFGPDRLHRLPFCIDLAQGDRPRPTPRSLPAVGRRLLFIGRMAGLKGGDVLLRALPEVARELGQPVRLTLAGDGPERATWERIAEEVRARDPRVAVDFAGWVDEARREELLGDADLLVVPSQWPEPFGRVGPEAGVAGVPAVAFDVGGVRDWLTPGANGHLAPGERPDGAGLAAAIVRALRDPAHHAELSRGAFALAQRFTRRSHVEALVRLFQSLVARPGGGRVARATTAHEREQQLPGDAPEREQRIV